MNYHLRSKPKRVSRGKILVVVGVFLLIALLVFFFPGTMRSGSYAIVRPLWKVGDIVARPFLKINDFFVFRNTLIEENMALQDEIASLKLRVMDYDFLFQENQELKTLMGRTAGTDRVLARVLSKPPRSPYDTFVLDIGSEEGIVSGSKVYLSDNVIIGSITDVSGGTSLVELFSSGGKTQEAVLQRTGASFTLSGNGGANLILEVPKDADILWGDVFMYPSLTSSVIGSVFYIDANSQSSFKEIHIRIPGNIFETKWLFVEKGE